MTHQQAEIEIEGLRQAISEWRETNHAPVPIPAEIWSGAARLAPVLGVGPVAKALRVDYAKLKRMVGGDTPSRVCRRRDQVTTATFLELSTRMGSLSCRLEVESREHATIRAQLEGATPFDVAAILREFAR